MDRGDQSSPQDERKQLLLPKPALVTNKSRSLNKRAKRVAFRPTLQDVQDSLSRKERRAGFSSWSDHATMETIECDFGIARSYVSSISLLAEIGSSVGGSSVNGVSFPKPFKQTPISHMRNVSDTAVFGDETSTASAKEPHPWTVWNPDPHSHSMVTYYERTRSSMNTSTATVASLDALMSHGAMTPGSRNVDASGSTSHEGKVCNTEVSFDPSCSPVYDYKAYVQSSSHASHHQVETAADLYNKDVNEPLPPRSVTRSTGIPPRPGISCRNPEAANASPKPVRADQPDQHHRCCIGVLSVFEAEFLSEEDKQAILDGGCHGLCTIQTTFLSNRSAANEEASNAGSLKSSLLARGPCDRPARFISPMPPKIMPNGRRGEKSTLPRFSRRRVAAEYKRPRSPLALVEHPSRRAGRSRGTLLVQPYSLEQVNRTSLRKVIRDSKPSTLADHRFSTRSLDHLFSINHQPKQKLKRQVKQCDLRHEFENDGHLAEEARSTLEANEAQIIVQAKEKSLSSRKLFKRLCTVF
ncbi:hypothetical protein KCU61_g7217, partial [Aureobasidium melanogenum]